MGKLLAGLLVLLLVAGCAGSDVAMREEPLRFPDEVVDSFVAGQTTRDEVRAMLGEPDESRDYGWYNRWIYAQSADQQLVLKFRKQALHGWWWSGRYRYLLVGFEPTDFPHDYGP